MSNFIDTCLGVFVLSIAMLFVVLALGVAGCVDSPMFNEPRRIEVDVRQEATK